MLTWESATWSQIINFPSWPPNASNILQHADFVNEKAPISLRDSLLSCFALEPRRPIPPFDPNRVGPAPHLCPSSRCTTLWAQGPQTQMGPGGETSRTRTDHLSRPVLLATNKVEVLRSVKRQINTQARRRSTTHRRSRKATSRSNQHRCRNPLTLAIKM
jgi:hypothetical protein